MTCSQTGLVAVAVRIFPSILPYGPLQSAAPPPPSPWPAVLHHLLPSPAASRPMAPVVRLRLTAVLRVVAKDDDQNMRKARKRDPPLLRLLHPPRGLVARLLCPHRPLLPLPHLRHRQRLLSSAVPVNNNQGLLVIVAKMEVRSPEKENIGSDCGCGRPCCYYKNPNCCDQVTGVIKPCCPPTPPPLPCCPDLSALTNCVANVPPCLRFAHPSSPLTRPLQSLPVLSL